MNTSVKAVERMTPGPAASIYTATHCPSPLIQRDHRGIGDAGSDPLFIVVFSTGQEGVRLGSPLDKGILVETVAQTIIHHQITLIQERQADEPRGGHLNKDVAAGLLPYSDLTGLSTTY